ncbi:MAG TPA: histidine phosphatase family protein [Caulobacteraceae bacterium]|jgi:phosphohistidine phosphatase|nr:histidine phosphatase family protein [Caulobacteraceae bacterium]
MQRLILLRHAKAERTATSGDDFDRALCERGKRDAKLMGEVLAERGVRPTRAWVSPALRTRETWAEAAPAFGFVEARFLNDLYHATASLMRRLIEGDEGEDGTVILVGHNPGLHQLAVDLLVEGAAGAREVDRMRGRFPTATAAVFDIDAAGRPVFDGLYLAADHGGGGGE